MDLIYDCTETHPISPGRRVRVFRICFYPLTLRATYLSAFTLRTYVIMLPVRTEKTVVGRPGQLPLAPSSRQCANHKQ